MSKTTELLQNHFEELQKKYQELLPKVDPNLINDLLLRQMENPGVAPIYMVEVFLEPGIDSQKVRETILQETGMAPAIYDNGTHIAVHHTLTLETLERISNREGVIEVTGEYDTGSWAASHEHRRHENVRIKTPSGVSSSQSIPAAETKEPMKKGIQESRKERRKSKYLVAVYTAAGIIGAIALAGFIISGGMLPNSNTGIQSSSTTDSIIGNEPGMLHGYVEGLSGLPAIGASVIAENLETGESTSAFVSLTGQYFIDLPPGTYEITVSFPNGATQVVDNFEISRGTAHELNFSYDE
ncbi:MAG: carboxypeptidase-like regulatory domain-containing protein [Thermoproteota archaeon]|nr:carboxypeptidase-like regulatory domain-containing protein [Thermoproteota archaeon]